MSRSTRKMHQLEEFEDWHSMQSEIREVCGSKPAVVLVTAAWCQPCKLLKASLSDRSKLSNDEYAKATWFLLDIDRNSKRLQEELDVRHVPKVLWVDERGRAEAIRGNGLLHGIRSRLSGAVE